MSPSDEQRDYAEEEAVRRDMIREGEEEAQAERTHQVVQLLHRSFLAKRADNVEEMNRLIREATQLDAQVVMAIRGGILIGEIPDPGRDFDGWLEFVNA